MTKNYRLKYWIFFITSILLNVTPLAVYAILALCQGQLVYQKVALTMTVFIVLIMTAISIVNKITLRSRLWLILIGVYVCIGEILTPLIIIACCQCVDEIIIHPLKQRYKTKLTISKEIDKRLCSSMTNGSNTNIT